METKTVTHGAINVTISQANVLIGMRRTRLQMEGREAQDDDIDRRLLRLYTYPDVMAATIDASGIDIPLDFESFLCLPDALVAQWEQAVYDLNPHWLPQPDTSEKKV